VNITVTGNHVEKGITDTWVVTTNRFETYLVKNGGNGRNGQAVYRVEWFAATGFGPNETVVGPHFQVTAAGPVSGLPAQFRTLMSQQYPNSPVR
jgi:hypothetical protein